MLRAKPLELPHRKALSALGRLGWEPELLPGDSFARSPLQSLAHSLPLVFGLARFVAATFAWYSIWRHVPRTQLVPKTVAGMVNARLRWSRH